MCGDKEYDVSILTSKPNPLGQTQQQLLKNSILQQIVALVVVPTQEVLQENTHYQKQQMPPVALSDILRLVQSMFPGLQNVTLKHGVQIRKVHTEAEKKQARTALSGVLPKAMKGTLTIDEQIEKLTSFLVTPLEHNLKRSIKTSELSVHLPLKKPKEATNDREAELGSETMKTVQKQIDTLMENKVRLPKMYYESKMKELQDKLMRFIDSMGI
eukprot:gene23470-28414_t